MKVVVADEEDEDILAAESKKVEAIKTDLEKDVCFF